MSQIYADRVRETCTVTATAVILTGAVPGFQRFAPNMAVGDTAYYCIENMSTPGQWEVGNGTLNADGTLTRTTVFSSSSGGLVPFASSDVLHVFLTIPATKVLDNSNEDMTYFGDGSDGDVTITSGTTTLSRDVYYRNLTISGTGQLSNNGTGWRIFVSGTLDLSNAPANAIIVPNAVSNASGTTGGAAVTQLGYRTIQNSDTCIAGPNGGATTGTNGTTNTQATGYAGGNPGAGGAGGTGASGAGGTGGAVTNQSFTVRPRHADTWIMGTGGSALKGGVNGPSGGSGGGDATAGGGAGAGGRQGGVLGIYARRIIRGPNTQASAISATGSAGGNGGVPAGGNRGGGGGGGGAGGGFVYIVCRDLLGTVATNAINVSGGAGGNGGAGTGTGTAGAGGTGGTGGSSVVIELGTETVTTFNGTSIAGSAPSGATGGAGGVARTNL